MNAGPATTSSAAQLRTRSEIRMRALDRLERKEIKPAFAVAQLLDRRPQPVEQREVQIRQRRLSGVIDVTPTLRGAADQHDRQVPWGVSVAVGHPAPEEQRHLIQQRAVAIRRRLE